MTMADYIGLTIFFVWHAVLFGLMISIAFESDLEYEEKLKHETKFSR